MYHVNIFHTKGVFLSWFEKSILRIFVFHRTYSTTKFNPDRDIRDVFFSV